MVKTTIQICIDLEDLTFLNEIRINSKQKNLSGAVVYLLKAYEQLLKIRSAASQGKIMDTYKEVRTEQVETGTQEGSWRNKYGLPP